LFKSISLLLAFLPDTALLLIDPPEDRAMAVDDENTRIRLSPLQLDPKKTLRREPPRPKHLRSPGYDERFDGLTIFYDCFQLNGGRGVLMLGPPLLNLERSVLGALRRAFRMSWFSRLSITRLDRLSQLRTGVFAAVELPAGLFHQARLVAQPNCSDLFHERRVIMTQTRNNELHWIRDWALFFVDKHGADAVLLYDNASTKYHTDQIRDVIHSVPGVDVGVVVDWPYPYGIRDGLRWDSDYGQYGMLEHARHRFLSGAQAVINCDIDEFPITEGGECLFDIATRSNTGYLKYGGQWVENASLSPDAATDRRRHKDYVYRSKKPEMAGEEDQWADKWTIVPSRHQTGAQWRVHDVVGAVPDPISELVRFRHFRAINQNWAFDRWHPEEPDACRHVVDEELREWLRMFE
jgi:hypothetical protein